MPRCLEGGRPAVRHRPSLSAGPSARGVDCPPWRPPQAPARALPSSQECRCPSSTQGGRTSIPRLTHRCDRRDDGRRRRDRSAVTPSPVRYSRIRVGFSPASYTALCPDGLWIKTPSPCPTSTKWIRSGPGACAVTTAPHAERRSRTKTRRRRVITKCLLWVHAATGHGVASRQQAARRVRSGLSTTARTVSQP